MIDYLEEKLKGELPIDREDLFELISSWGRDETFTTHNDNITIKECKPKECYPLENLDVSKITDLSYIFFNSFYNGELSKWDVSNVENMECMFCVSSFNNNSLKDWDVSKVKNIDFMFYKSKFNGNISSWNVSNVINFESSFDKCSFNGDTNEFKKKIAFLFKFFNEIFVSLKQCGLNYVISNRFSLLESLIN